jgi:hypothetical protein
MILSELIREKGIYTVGFETQSATRRPQPYREPKVVDMVLEERQKGLD